MRGLFECAIKGIRVGSGYEYGENEYEDSVVEKERIQRRNKRSRKKWKERKRCPPRPLLCSGWDESSCPTHPSPLAHIKMAQEGQG